MNKFIKQLSLGAISLGIICCTSVPAFASTSPVQTKSISSCKSISRSCGLDRSNTEATLDWTDNGIKATFTCDDGRPHDLKLHIEIMDKNFKIVRTIDRYANDFELSTTVPVRSNYHHAVCKFYGDGEKIWFVGAMPENN